METTMKSGQGFTKDKAENKNKSVSSRWEQAEANRFGIIPILIVIIGCVGGLSAAFGAQGDPLKLSLVAFPTIIALALMLAVAPMRLVLYVSIIAIILDLIALAI
jgi:hypothetical protein